MILQPFHDWRKHYVNLYENKCIKYRFSIIKSDCIRKTFAGTDYRSRNGNAYPFWSKAASDCKFCFAWSVGKDQNRNRIQDEKWYWSAQLLFSQNHNCAKRLWKCQSFSLSHRAPCWIFRLSRLCFLCWFFVESYRSQALPALFNHDKKIQPYVSAWYRLWWADRQRFLWKKYLNLRCRCSHYGNGCPYGNPLENPGYFCPLEIPSGKSASVIKLCVSDAYRLWATTWIICTKFYFLLVKWNHKPGRNRSFCGTSFSFK